MLIDEQELRTRVRRGAELLDEVDTGWPARVNIKELNMYSCLTCVLGQALGSYSAGLAALDIWIDEEDGWTSSQCGFSLDNDHHDIRYETRNWDRLRDIWITEINSRRKETPCSQL